MTKPVESDFINAYFVTQRILLRKMFENLKNRPQSKYFKNIVIKNVEWNKKTFCNNSMPLNFPQEFLEKYPFDFEVSFTSLGCNMLKCYNSYRKYTTNSSSQPILINDYILGGGEACLAVYEEFNSYVKEKFELTVEKKNDDDDNADRQLPFETLSIQNKIGNENYCGIQLTPLKTFSILPASRWYEEGTTAKEYVDKYKNTAPLQLRELAGLVDAPPLTWNKERQDTQFNRSYCRRFNKQYDNVGDNCFHHFVRTGVNYLLGENFVNNAFPNLENILINGAVPFEHLNALVMGHGLKVNDGYKEQSISQMEFERRAFVDKPDIATEKCRIIDNSSAYSQRIRRKLAVDVSNIFADIISQIAVDTAVELSVTTLPSIGARLLKNYSSKFLQRALLVQHSSTLPTSIRFFSLTVRVVVNELTIKMAIKMLTFISSAANAIFAVTLFTMIPDILLTYYNIGGFNNEISREHLIERRKFVLESLLKSSLEQHGDLLINYIVLDDGRYVSPIITPEFIYHLCLLNFLKSYPDKAVDICHNALASDDEYESVALDYIKHLKINALGQRIVYNDNDNNNDIENKINLAEDDNTVFINNIIKSKNNNNNKNTNYNLIDLTIKYQIDIYLIIIGTILLLLVSFILLMGSHHTLACILLYNSILFYLLWFTVFLPIFRE